MKTLLKGSEFLDERSDNAIDDFIPLARKCILDRGITWHKNDGFRQDKLGVYEINPRNFVPSESDIEESLVSLMQEIDTGSNEVYGPSHYLMVKRNKNGTLSFRVYDEIHF